MCSNCGRRDSWSVSILIPLCSSMKLTKGHIVRTRKQRRSLVAKNNRDCGNNPTHLPSSFGGGKRAFRGGRPDIGNELSSVRMLVSDLPQWMVLFRERLQRTSLQFIYRWLLMAESDFFLGHTRAIIYFKVTLFIKRLFRSGPDPRRLFPNPQSDSNERLGSETRIIGGIPAATRPFGAGLFLRAGNIKSFESPSKYNSAFFLEL